MADFNLGHIEVSGATGIDALFRREKRTPKRVKVATLRDLHPFLRLSSDTLIHKSDRDLWALKKEGNGDYFIERLFDDNGEPLKG